MTNDLILPTSATLVTKDVVASWYKWFDDMAGAEIARRIEEGAVFDGAGEKEWEHHRLMLDYCSAADSVSEGVRQQVLALIARKHLYEHAPEGWSSLADVIREAVPSYTSKGTSHQLTTLAEVVAPFCDEHGIDVYEEPGAVWNLGEAASHLARTIRDTSIPAEERAERVRDDVEFASTHSRREVRDKFRQYRGDPARGYTAQLVTNESGLLILGNPDVIEAARQRIGNLVRDWRPGEGRVEKGEFTKSKANPKHVVRTHTTSVGVVKLQVFTLEGEPVEEVEK